MIDIGINISRNNFNEKSIFQSLVDAKKNGIEIIFLTTTSEKNYLLNIKTIKQWNNESQLPKLYTTFGIHPHNAKDFNSYMSSIPTEDLQHIKAIGEIGLDYNRNLSTPKQQQKVFELFLEQANKHVNLPLFLHERDAENDFISILKNSNSINKKVVHCFTGNSVTLKKYLDLGYYIGITGWITDPRRNTELLESLKYIPLDKIMIETDSPYLLPKNIDKKNYTKDNEPGNLIFIAQYIATKLNMKTEDFISKSSNNTKLFFNL